ncbi:uncharacterized protein K02A2.6-like [Anneissia japonica]|uniref:uncharacterized protein K02A2.6-like n=1 Tax=Anneissia japonica TaxID=1529436 RepID=UPI001425B3C6|nr:uncharacterized protein K02A2.6-like [Anneissia japonica]
MEGEEGSITAKLANFLLAYRNAPHCTTGQPPAVLFMGRNIRSRLDILKPDLRRHVQSKQVDQTVSHKANKRTRTFNVGKAVAVRDYRNRGKWTSGTIHTRTGPLSYVVCVGPNVLWRRHVDQIINSNVQSKQVCFENCYSEPDITPDPVTAEIPPPLIELPLLNETRTYVSPTESTDCSNVASPDKPERRYPLRMHKSPDRLSF